MSKKEPFIIPSDPSNPSTADIIAAFARAMSTERVTVSIALSSVNSPAPRIMGRMDLRITGLEYESSFEGMFIFKAFARLNGKDSGTCHGFYDANLRQGHLEFDD